MKPSGEDLKTCSGTCPICHDNLQEPTILHCKHIFCEECAATWFDKERTCPMCRAEVKENGKTSLDNCDEVQILFTINLYKL